jgi:KDEL-tailed cysteine endopeptidase
VTAAGAVDWRAAGGVTGVKDQGQCGSCWAFSTTGSIEGANFVVNNQLTSLSEQELIDCDRSGNDRGCNGGLMDYAYEWIISNGGIDTEKDYPYTATDTVCDDTKEHTVAVAVGSFEDVPPNNEAALKKAATMQPVSIAIAASGLPFQLYSHGVFNGSCSNQLDHGVLIVGYDTDAETGQEYWIVKNSWGAVWGEQGACPRYLCRGLGAHADLGAPFTAGFIRMAMNHGTAGLCGLAMVPSYPVVKKAGPPGPPTPPGPSPTPPATVTCDSKTGSQCPSTATCCCSLKIPYINYCVQWCVAYGCCSKPASADPRVLSFPPPAGAAGASRLASRSRFASTDARARPQPICCGDLLQRRLLVLPVGPPGVRPGQRHVCRISHRHLGHGSDGPQVPGHPRLLAQFAAAPRERRS